MSESVRPAAAPGRQHVHKESARNTGDPKAWSAMTNRTPARDRPVALGRRRGSQYRGSRVMPGEGRDLSSRRTQDVVKDLEIGQPINSEECSETAEGVARESEGRSRLSLLRPLRQDQPRRHLGPCLCPVPLQQGRTGGGRSRVCGHRSVWVERWVGELALALRQETYRPDPIRRVFIPKANGKLRPLGISTLRDRVCMTAAMLVLEPIFEADLPPE